MITSQSEQCNYILAFWLAHQTTAQHTPHSAHGLTQNGTDTHRDKKRDQERERVTPLAEGHDSMAMGVKTGRSAARTNTSVKKVLADKVSEARVGAHNGPQVFEQSVNCPKERHFTPHKEFAVGRKRKLGRESSRVYDWMLLLLLSSLSFLLLLSSLSQAQPNSLTERTQASFGLGLC